MDNKETDVIGRKGSVITVWVKMSDTNAVVGREITRRKSKAQDLVSGCLNSIQLGPMAHMLNYILSGYY